MAKFWSFDIVQILLANSTHEELQMIFQIPNVSICDGDMTFWISFFTLNFTLNWYVDQALPRHVVVVIAVASLTLLLFVCLFVFFLPFLFTIFFAVCLSSLFLSSALYYLSN